jgi:hypothetical protein
VKAAFPLVQRCYKINVMTILYFNVLDFANLKTDQDALQYKAARDARAAVGVLITSYVREVGTGNHWQMSRKEVR